MNKKILEFIFIISICQMSFFVRANASNDNLGRIIEVKGSGFLSQDGKTEELRKGTIIKSNSEIVVEHSGQVTYADNYNRHFILGNSSAMAISKKGIELRSGNLWVQSKMTDSSEESVGISTANSLVEFQKGEGIITYDTEKGKTQLLVINGLIKFLNWRIKELNVTVSEGNFSYIDNAYDEGAPREPTPVGEKTFKALTAEFIGVTPMNKGEVKATVMKNNGSHGDDHHANEVVVKRSIASVTDNEKSENEHAKHAFIENEELEKYKKGMLEKKSKQELKKVEKKVYTKASQKVKVVASPLVVHIFGQKSISKENEKISNRAPASLNPPEMATIENKAESNKINKQPTVPSKETEKLLEKLNKL